MKLRNVFNFGSSADSRVAHEADHRRMHAHLSDENPTPIGSLADIVAACEDAKADGVGVNAGVVQLGTGDCVLTDTADLYRGAAGLQVKGRGQSTRLICGFNDPTKPMVKIANSQRSLLEDVQLIVPAGTAAKAAVQIVYDMGEGINPRWNTVRNVVIEPQGSGALTYGLLIGDDGSAPYRDNTNDFHKFEDVEIKGCIEACAAIGGGNSYQSVFRDCQFTGGKYGVLAGRGSYSWWGGGMYDHTVACFTKGHWYGAVEIHSVVCERTECFIKTSGGDFIVVGGRWDDSGSTGMKAVYVDTLGAEVQMMFLGTLFGDGSTDKPIVFDCANAGENSAIVFNPCVIYSTADPLFMGVHKAYRNVRVLDEDRNIRQLLPDIG